MGSGNARHAPRPRSDEEHGSEDIRVLSTWVPTPLLAPATASWTSLTSPPRPLTAKVLTISALGLLISRPSTYAKDKLETVSFSFGSSRTNNRRRWRRPTRSHPQSKDVEGQFNAHPSRSSDGTNHTLKASESQGSLLSRRRESENAAPPTTTSTDGEEWGPNDMQPVVPDRRGGSGDRAPAQSTTPSPTPRTPERAVVRSAAGGGGSWRVDPSWKLVSRA
jgi:hypothetical protein